MYSVFFFFNDTATTEIYTLSLHDALPISVSSSKRASASASRSASNCSQRVRKPSAPKTQSMRAFRDRKSTRLNSSHLVISYAVFCLKKKKKKNKHTVIARYTVRGISSNNG